MPPKKKQKKIKKEKHGNIQAEDNMPIVCGFRGPGPVYKLKPVVGYDDHCHSKLRNPAYTILGKRPAFELAQDGPGPIYLPKFPPTDGFSFGVPLPPIKYESSPGPYTLPTPKITPITMKWRTKPRGVTASAGPYDLPRTLNGPKFTIGVRLRDSTLEGGPGPGPAPQAPKGPAFSIGHRPPGSRYQANPGPYDPVDLNKGPAFTFGRRYPPCVAPLITECDKSC
ncbi:hypothetical protein HCN44_005870 [Aphidius gifuensis]|uniref:Uncharacterized protein n=1 Tax=Aphidius gifuensis TaxID=684658 RepID=A0A835CQP1_APHGI|nr:outer dense fiber protein 3B-like [Aphidius gifuensis]KAF7993089.1 hypothetical protein HCN44_005870 [Aphidius gifuensis]